METKTAYTSAQLAYLERMGAALASVPEDKRKNASNEAAAYIRGFASGVQSMQSAQVVRLGP